MAQIVADGLEREVALDKPLRDAVPQRVRAEAGSLDSRCEKVVACTLRHDAPRDRLLRCPEVEEQPTVLRFGTTVLQVVDQ